LPGLCCRGWGGLDPVKLEIAGHKRLDLERGRAITEILA
jgi:hypothetical protein